MKAYGEVRAVISNDQGAVVIGYCVKRVSDGRQIGTVDLFTKEQAEIWCAAVNDAFEDGMHQILKGVDRLITKMKE